MGFNNVLVVCGGFIFQPLVGFLLRTFWDGTVVNNVHVYQVSDYQIALSIVPICFALGIILSIFGVKETHCQSYLKRKEQNEQTARA